MSENNENETQATESQSPGASVSESAEQVPSVESSEVSYEEIVEIPWEKAEHVFRTREAFKEMQQHVAGFLLDSERRKTAMMDRLAEMETTLYESAGELQQDPAINPEWVYELKLPQQPEEKAYLIRKQE